MAQVLVRIPDDLHRRFKTKLAATGLTMRECIQQWIEADVKDVDLRHLKGG